MSKKSMTINLTDEEMKVLEQMAKQKDLTKTAVIRQAIRLYQFVDVKTQQGDKMFFENSLSKDKSELMVL